MDIAKKVEYAKVYIDSITTHDDAPMEDVVAAVAELQAHAQQQVAAAQARRDAAEQSA